MRVDAVGPPCPILPPASPDLLRPVPVRQECENRRGGGSHRAPGRPQKEISHQVVHHAQRHQPSVERGAFRVWEGLAGIVAPSAHPHPVTSCQGHHCCPSLCTFFLSLSRWIDPAARNGISQDCGSRRERQILGTEDHPNRCHPVRSVKTSALSCTGDKSHIHRLKLRQPIH